MYRAAIGQVMGKPKCTHERHGYKLMAVLLPNHVIPISAMVFEKCNERNGSKNTEATLPTGEKM
jgi:hypothetical protein